MDIVYRKPNDGTSVAMKEAEEEIISLTDIR